MVFRIQLFWVPFRKNPKEILEIKNSATEMNNYFNELVSTLDTAAERLSNLENISIETPKPEK